MFDMPDPTFFNHLKRTLTGVMSGCGLLIVTDVEQPGNRGLFEGLEVAEGDADKYDDRPAIERLIKLLIKPKKRDPKVQRCRLLAVIPNTFTVPLRVAIECTPVPEEDVYTLIDDQAYWQIKFEAGSRGGANFEGKPTDAGELDRVLQSVTAVCEAIQQAHRLRPVAQYEQVGAYGAVAGAVSAGEGG